MPPSARMARTAAPWPRSTPAPQADSSAPISQALLAPLAPDLHEAREQ
jgi:hypothetical protein